MGNQQNLPAKEQLRERAMNSFGVWHICFSYLTPPEQISLQVLNWYAYQLGVPRIQRAVRLDEVFCLPHKRQIMVLRRWSDKFTLFNPGIESWDYQSVQIGKDVFQFKISDSTIRMLLYQGDSKFKVVDKASIRGGFGFELSLCSSMDDKFIFATGGYYLKHLRQAKRYNNAREVWDEMPPMNVARSLHGSCTLGTTLYVVCGKTTENNSIEKLHTHDLHANWQLIQIPLTSLLTPQWCPVVASLNSSEILVMGRANRGNPGDALIYNPLQDSVKKAACETPFRFDDRFVPQKFTVRPGVAVALVLREKKHKFHVIKYEGGNLRILHQF